MGDGTHHLRAALRSDCYRGAKPGGLQVPSGDEHDHADYWDFVYFSFVIGMTAQVSDVGITDKTIRRTHRTRHHLVCIQYRAARLDGQHLRECDLDFWKTSFRDGPKDQTSDVQLHIR